MEDTRLSGTSRAAKKSQHKSRGEIDLRRTIPIVVSPATRFDQAAI